MSTLLLVVMLISGETWSRPVPAANCPEVAKRIITIPEVTTAWCADPKSLRPVFTTVSM